MPTRPPRAYAQGQPSTPRPRVRRPSPHQSLYDTPEWKRASKEFRALHPWCCCEEHRGRPGSARSECVDHVVPHRGDPVKFWNRANWRAMAWRCHTRKTNRYDGAFGNPRKDENTTGQIARQARGETAVAVPSFGHNAQR